jgi:hypothetical protein
MQAQTRRCIVSCLMVILAALGGCAPPTAKVKGSVTYNGVPVDFGSVVFFVDDKNAIPVQLGPEGTFTAMGLPYGEAKVEVHSRPPDEGRVRPKHTKSTKEAPVIEPKGVEIPEDYNDKDKSGLKLTIDRAIIEYKIELKDPE